MTQPNEIDIGELRKRKIMVGTPMYGGQCGGQYAKSCIDLQHLAKLYDMDVTFFFLYNESLITRARNYLADEFVRSKYTHLMFIDSDIGFDPNDVIELAARADPNSDKDIICAPYPKKVIAWEKIKRAVDKGFADKNPNDLERYVGDFVFNPVSGGEIPIFEPVEVLESGTGMMMIQRSVFESMSQEYPQLKYRPDHVRTDHFDGSREIYAYFDALIDDKNANVVAELKALKKVNPNASFDDIIAFMSDKNHGLAREYSNRYLSEDYMFCQWARNIGKKVWLCPWMKTTHMGSYMFGGSLVDLAQLGVAATADVHALNKAHKLNNIGIDNAPLKI
jgi:hypothetical protein